MADEIFLKQGLQANLDIGSFGVISVDARDGYPLTVHLGVADNDDEHDFELHPGDTFPVRDQTWKLDRVENPGSRDRIVVLSRVE